MNVVGVVGFLMIGNCPVDETNPNCEGNDAILTIADVATSENEADSNEADATPERITYDWDEGDPAAKNYFTLGRLLFRAARLFRRPTHGDGLIKILHDETTTTINSAVSLAAVIADYVDVTVFLNGRVKGNKLPAGHLNAMLRSEAFLSQFPTVDYITRNPIYLPTFSVTEPGYTNGGPGFRCIYQGEPARILDGLDHVNAFLNVMAFNTVADRANAVAAALTVTLRQHWRGAKPIILVTATKSHAGKDTVILFTSGPYGQSSISYQSTDWALERSFVGAVTQKPDVGVLVVENARLDRRQNHIASGFIERFVMDPYPTLFSTGTGPPLQRCNDIVVAISTNYGSVSEDILNRSLPIHLSPVGNVHDRVSPIGNPKLEYLPKFHQEIAAELRGMIERWIEEGQPLDTSVRHPFSPWATTIGGILQVNGFNGFLSNYGIRKTDDDPLRHALGLLGAGHSSDEWRRAGEWARLAVRLGLAKQVIPRGDLGSAEGERRGMGVVLSAHLDEVFRVETESQVLHLRLERRRGRFGEAEGHVRYRFVVMSAEPLADDPEPRFEGEAASDNADAGAAAADSDTSPT